MQKRHREIKGYYLMVSRRCNLKCKYCYQLNKPDSDMSPEVVEQVIDFLRRDDPGKLKQLNFFGGEPTMNWDAVVKITESFRRLDDWFTFGITTNGTLLTEERLAYLRKRKFGFAFSIDGPPGVTMKTRPGSEKADVKMIQSYFPNAQIIITLSPENIEDAYLSTLWLVEQGFTKFAHNIATEKPWPRGAIEKHHEFFKELSGWQLAQGMKRGVDFMYIGFAAKAIQKSAQGGQPYICGSSANQLAIDTNGDIYPCQDMVTCDTKKMYTLGSLKTGYEPAQRIPVEKIKFPHDRAECDSCWFKMQCVGGCGPKNLLTCGDRFTMCDHGCEMISRQTQEGFRVLLNSGRIQMRDMRRK